MDGSFLAIEDSAEANPPSRGGLKATSRGVFADTVNSTQVNVHSAQGGPRSPDSSGRGHNARAGVLVVDEHPLFREGLRACLEGQAHLKFCGEAESLENARQAIRTLHPEVLLLGLSLEGGEPSATIKRLRRDFPALHILALIRKDEMLAGEGALRAGAHGLITKDQSAEDFLQAIGMVLRGEIYLNKTLTALMLKKAYFGDKTDDLTGKLSNRELQVFGLLGLGHGTREIASKLSLSRRTVNVHRENIKHKLGLKAASSLVYAAITWMNNRPSASAEPSGQTTPQLAA
jgi:DNA-binding NarL/FixJ family response regulator